MYIIVNASFHVTKHVIIGMCVVSELFKKRALNRIWCISRYIYMYLCVSSTLGTCKGVRWLGCVTFLIIQNCLF